jgi:hypothetical protein
MPLRNHLNASSSPATIIVLGRAGPAPENPMRHASQATDRLPCVLPSPGLPLPRPMRRKWFRVICFPWREDAPGDDGQASRYRLRWTAYLALEGVGHHGGSTSHLFSCSTACFHKMPVIG